MNQERVKGLEILLQKNLKQQVHLVQREKKMLWEEEELRFLIMGQTVCRTTILFILGGPGGYI